MEEEFSFSRLFSEFAKLGDISEYKKSIVEIADYSTQLNKTLGENRQRIGELYTAIADTTPGIIRLGGEISDVSRTIGEIASESRRSFIASSETVKELYAVSELLNDTVGNIVREFIDIGIATNNIGENIEESINYVQSIGGNANVVMKEVVNNMSQLNRYNFEGGVLGFTKMAAKASMLRFDMNQVLSLADSLIKPERAVEVASAFQRLGVSAGNLVDPFQLMNQSINDPSGLLDSLSDVAKSFAEFDSETKSFKISRQGVLTLKELSTQIGLSSEELSKMALASAELDARLSQISPTIKFANEEDKQYLANIASMNERGEYIIKIDNDETKLLSEVTQEEMNKLVEAQKSQPKTLEDIQRNSLKLTDIIMKDVEAIRRKIVGGIITAPTVTDIAEKTRRVTSAATGTLSEIGSVSGVRGLSEQGIDNLVGLIKDFFDKNKTTDESLTDFMSKTTDMFKSIGGNISDNSNEYMIKLGEKLRQNNIDISKLTELFPSNDDSIFSDLLNKLNVYNKGLDSFDDTFDAGISKYTNEFKSVVDAVNKGTAKPEELSKYIKDNRNELEKYGTTFTEIMSRNADNLKGYFESGNKNQEQLNQYLGKYDSEIKSYGDSFDVKFQKYEKDIESIISKVKSGNERPEALSEYMLKNSADMRKFGESFSSNMTNYVDQIRIQLSTNATQQKTDNTKIQDGLIQVIEGKNSINPIEPSSQNKTINTSELNTTTVIHKIQFDKLPVEIQLPANFSQLNTEQQQKVLDNVFNSPSFKTYVNSIISAQNQNPTKAPISTNINQGKM